VISLFKALEFLAV